MTTCPTCGSPVVLAAGDEGTNHYVPAKARQVTEAFAELDRIRAELDRAVETRENANTVSVRVEAENKRLRKRLREEIEEWDRLHTSEVERADTYAKQAAELRAIIGNLYEARGQSREGLYCAIKQAYRAVEGSL